MELPRNILKIAQAILLCFVILTYSASALAVPIEEIPNPRQGYGGWVTDSAQILNSETKITLNQIISRFEKDNGTEIAIVTVPDTSPSKTPKQYATSLFNYWGIGKQGIDNGVLFLVSKGDRRVEIETGRGIQSKLSNFSAKKIIQQNVLPYFRQDNFSTGTLSGTLELIRVLKEQPDSTPPHSSASPKSPALATAYPHQGLQMVLVSLLVGVVGILSTSISFPIFLQPEGRSRTFDRRIRSVRCRVCYKPMTQLLQDVVRSQMNQPEQVAQSLGSVRVDGWKCMNCHPKLTDSGIHLRTCILDSYQFSLCPNCQELTVTSTRTLLQSSTPEQPDQYKIIEQCQCCDYCHEEEISASCISREDTSFADSVGWSGGSSDSGGSDFGGGSSDGGGDGGSW